MSDTQKFNHLRDEASVFLKRNAKSEIDWHPYGPQALSKAKEENKPIFISLGYATCHWCQKMEEDSFSSQETIQFLNENFINIKVDKDEMPDLDNYLQLACQVINGRGGWPLNVFLTSDFQPYFAGTYFPSVNQKDIPSFQEVALNMAKAYKEDFDTVKTNAENIVTALKQNPTYENKVDFDGHFPTASAVLNALKDYQDNDFGGYGTEPKFPNYAFYEWAVEHMLEGMIPEEQGNHIIKSIEAMLMGGMNDHVKGGVHRYCIDQSWKTPHFEKMLYDQAGLLRMLTKVSLIYPSPLVFDTIIQTLDYLRTEMLSEKGFFFNSQDSRSEGIEGLYFCFSKDEFIDALVDFDESLSDNMDKYLKWFNITQEGNYTRGLNIIHLNKNDKTEFYDPNGWNEVRKVRQALQEARKFRIPPVTDNKGSATANFLVLSALMDLVQYTRIEPIRNSALDLLSRTNQAIHETFLYTDERGRTRLKPTTTRPGHVPLFENYVYFADFSLRFFELFGQENAQNNGIQTLKFLSKEFFKDGHFLARSNDFTDTEAYENIHPNIFDNSYKSALANYIFLIRKWSLVDEDLKEIVKTLESSIETLTHLSLQNPLAFGETLRALIYPSDAFRAIEVPFAWLQNNKFQKYFLNFSSRFILQYHQEDNENWKIENRNEVELKGDSFEEFEKVFQAPESSNA